MIDPDSVRRAFDRSILPIAAGGAAASLGALALVLLRPPWWPAPFAVVLALPMLAVGIAGRVRRRGARADRRLRQVLESLQAKGYRCWQDVECGGDVLPHVVLGPTGVFVVIAAGSQGDHLQGADRDALAWTLTRQTVALRRRLAGVGLRVIVQGIVAVRGRNTSPGPAQVGTATVVPVGSLAGFVRSGATRLGPAQIEGASAAQQGAPARAERPGDGR